MFDGTVQRQQPQDFGLTGLALVVGSALAGAKGQRDANTQNQLLSDENRKWQEAMSDSAYQRAVRDLAKAGLNPMLAYSQGGASTPNQAPPVMQNAAAQGTASASAGMQMIQSAQSIAQSQEQMQQMRAQTKKIESETVENALNTAEKAAAVKKLQMEGRKTEEEIPGARAAAQRSKQLLEEETRPGEYPHSAFAADVRRRKAEAAIREYGVDEAKAGSQFYRDVGEMPSYIRMIMELLRGVSSARGALR